MRWMPLCLVLAICSGCATTREITIKTTPVPATISLEGIDIGKSPLRSPFTFENGKMVFHIQASAKGYVDQKVDVTLQSPPEVVINLPPVSRAVTINVEPQAKLSIDGQPVAAGMVGTFTTELVFPYDEKTGWGAHRITAERPGYQIYNGSISYSDNNKAYSIVLEPMRKDITITTTPPGAKVVLDDQEVGVTPLTQRAQAFLINLETSQWNEYRLHITKPGYDPIDTKISWDDGKVNYDYDLRAKHKRVRITTDPIGATLTLDGKDLPKDASGAYNVDLAFPPVNDAGQLCTHEIVANKKTADSEWYPAKKTIGWDSGQIDYVIPLKEIKILNVDLLQAQPSRTDNGWIMLPKHVPTIAMKDTTEPNPSSQITRVTNLPKGTVVDSLAMSPDGSRIVFTTLQSTDAADVRGQIMIIQSNGGGGIENLGDSKNLNIHPSFTPDGRQIVFSSNRAGRRQSIWTQSSSGAPGITQLTTGDTNDLWPVIDPTKRLFYQAFVDTRSDARLFMSEAPLGKTTRTDITQAGGMQPRVSPNAGPDSGTILFTAYNEKTGKRNLFRVPVKGGVAENISANHDADEFDACWSPDGTKIAYVSDAGVDEEKRHNYDIWVMDLSGQQQPTQITTNGSWDDCPVWDASGTCIYFRSNRGGEWAIWKVKVK